MRFGDSETQRMLRSTARSYLADKFPWERLYTLERGDERLTDVELQGFADLGWLSLLAPESAGGGGVPLLEAAAVIEELGYAAVPAPVAVSNIAAWLLSRVPAESAAREHLSPPGAAPRPGRRAAALPRE